MAYFGPLLGAKILQSMTISSLAPGSILWLWDLPKNRAYLSISMGFINFFPLMVVFAHFPHLGGQKSRFKRFDYFVGAPWWPPKVLNPCRYPHYSCKIGALPKNMNMLKNEGPQYHNLLNPWAATTTTTFELEKSSFTKIFEGDFFPPIFVYQRDYLWSYIERFREVYCWILKTI